MTCFKQGATIDFPTGETMPASGQINSGSYMIGVKVPEGTWGHGTLWDSMGLCGTL